MKLHEWQVEVGSVSLGPTFTPTSVYHTVVYSTHELTIFSYSSLLVLAVPLHHTTCSDVRFSRIL